MAERPVPLTLREPARGEIWGRDVVQMSGLEMLRAYLERRLPDPPITKLTGLRLSEASLGVASASMPASPWWQSGAGVFLAGTVAFLADLPLGGAVLTSVPAGWGMTTSELSVNFLRTPTIRNHTIIGRGRLIHATRSLGLSEVTVEDSRGRLLGHATSRCVLFRLDPELMAATTPPKTAPDASSPDPYLRSVEGDVRGREFLSDAAMIVAVGSTLPAGTAFNTMDLKINFLRPVLPGEGELTAQAKVIYRGRTVAVANCEVRDPDGKLAAQATASFLLLPGRYWETPVHVGDEINPETS